MTNRSSDAASAPLTPEQIRALRELLEKATAGPWTNGMRGPGSSGDAHMCRIISREEDTGKQVGLTWHPDFIVSYVGISRQQCIDNAELICALRNHGDALLSLLDQQAVALTQAQQEIATLKQNMRTCSEMFCEFRDARRTASTLLIQTRACCESIALYAVTLEKERDTLASEIDRLRRDGNGNAYAAVVENERANGLVQQLAALTAERDALKRERDAAFKAGMDAGRRDFV